MVSKAPYILADVRLHSERLIEISRFMAQRFEDIGDLKAGVQDAGQRISEIHLTVQNNQQRIETQAAQHQSELRSIMGDYQNKIENQFSQLEKMEQSKGLSSLCRESADPPKENSRMKSFDGSRSPTQSQITLAHAPVTSQEQEIGLPKV
jgi:hypothetical protein